MFWEIVSTSGDSMGFFTDEAEAWACFSGVDDGVRLVGYDGDSFEGEYVVEEYEAWGSSHLNLSIDKERDIAYILAANSNTPMPMPTEGFMQLLRGYSLEELQPFVATAKDIHEACFECSKHTSGECVDCQEKARG